MNAGATVATLGAATGYIFDENLSFWQKFSIQGIKDYIRDRTDVLVEKRQEPVQEVEVQKSVEAGKETTHDKDKQRQTLVVLQKKESIKKGHAAEPATTKEKKHKRHTKISHAAKHKQDKMHGRQTSHRAKHKREDGCPVKKVLQNEGRQGQSKAESEKREKAVTGVSHHKLS